MASDSDSPLSAASRSAASHRASSTRTPRLGVFGAFGTRRSCQRVWAHPANRPIIGVA